MRLRDRLFLWRELFLMILFLARERLGCVWCLWVHMWPCRRLWIVTIGSHSGLKVIICRRCGRQWSFRPAKGWE